MRTLILESSHPLACRTRRSRARTVVVYGFAEGAEAIWNEVNDEI
jgi:hypothetical protein